ncbi:hypothetical protein EIN_453190 [Entamoeba invadens IP1]|uniref:UBR-type domain-containing protein n=1 Tax=Entamoeba invadens IP1 TaxID=370355 RepID=L7FM21_ENTIV|nr:hypothetical protein EIN_453190 [Entamoeba invadens IP1]ELP89689.1 hypothetical protein EIN_453190 [Entamoeba invadens IP1]|eukprot:XP_004256460.1 hypothetical protein EIN_453190 [Entamoeba invadens IP1]
MADKGTSALDTKNGHPVMQNDIKTLISNTLDKNRYLDRLLFFDDVEPMKLLKYQKTDRCYNFIPAKAKSFQCLNCSEGRSTQYIVCQECEVYHRKAGHLLLENKGNDVDFCRCGDFMFDGGRVCPCQLHTTNCLDKKCLETRDEETLKQILSEDEYTDYIEKKAIDRNVEKTFKKLGLVAKFTVPEIVKLVCVKMAEILNENSDNDTEMFVYHVVRWLNKIVSFQPVRDVMKSVLLESVDIEKPFLLTEMLDETVLVKHAKRYKVTRVASELENVETSKNLKICVTVHDIFLNFCVFNKLTSTYTARLLYLLMDDNTLQTFEAAYRKVFGSIPVYGTLLPKLFPPMTERYKPSDLVPHFLNTTIVLLRNNKTFESNEVHVCLSYFMSSKDVVEAIVNDKENLKDFIEFADTMTMYPTPESKITRTIAKQFDKFFLSVFTKIRMFSTVELEDERKVVEINREAVKSAANKLRKKLSGKIDFLKKVILGLDDKTEVNFQLFPTQFYLINIVGFAGHLINASKALPTSVRINESPLKYLGFGDVTDKRNLLETLVLIYYIGRKRDFDVSLISLKLNKEQQEEIEDFFGEIKSPLLTSTVLHTVQLFPPEEISNFMRRTDVVFFQNENERVNQIIRIEFLNLYLGFSRFSGKETSLGEYMRYLGINYTFCPIISLQNKDVIDYIKDHQQHTEVQQQEDLRRTGMSSRVLSQVLVTSVSDGRVSVHHGKKSEKRKSVMTSLKEAAKKSKVPKSSQPVIQDVKEKTSDLFLSTQEHLLRIENTDFEVLFYRKVKEMKKTMTVEEYEKIKGDWKIEQNTLVVLGEPNLTSVNVPVDFENGKVVYNDVDYFFAFLNDTYSVAFRKQMIGECLVDPISKGDFNVFFSFFAPPYERQQKVPVCQNDAKTLLTHDNFKQFFDYKKVNMRNYPHYFRLAFYILRNTPQMKENAFKMVAACCGYFFWDLMHFIPYPLVEKLFDFVYKKIELFGSVQTEGTKLGVTYPTKFFLETFDVRPCEDDVFIKHIEQKVKLLAGFEKKGKW